MAKLVAGGYRLGDIEIDVDAFEVRKGGERLHLGRRAFDLLVVMLRHGTELVSREELLAHGWPGVVVEPNNLTVQVAGLRKLLGAELIVTVSGRGYKLARTSEALGGEPVDEEPHVAILPFNSDSPEDQRCAEGLRADLATALGRFRELKIAAPEGSDSGTPPRVQTSRVSYLVEGAVRREKGKLRVVVRLLEPAARQQIWADAYTRVPGQILAMQEELAATLAAALQPQIDLAHRNAAQIPPRAGNAYSLALAAWAILRRHDQSDDKARRERARRLAKKALQLDSTCSLAARTFAWAQFSELFVARNPATEHGAREAVDVLTRAGAADPLDHNIYHHRGLLQFFLDRHMQGIDDLRRARDLNPNSPATLAYLGYFEAICGNALAGLALAERSLAISPRDPQRYLLHTQAAACSFVALDDERALAHARKSAADALWFPAAWLWVAIVCVALKRKELASEAVKTLRQLSPDYLALRLSGRWPGTDQTYAIRATHLLREAVEL